MNLKLVVVWNGEGTSEAVLVEKEASDALDIRIVLRRVGQGIERGMGVVEGKSPDAVDGVSQEKLGRTMVVDWRPEPACGVEDVSDGDVGQRGSWCDGVRHMSKVVDVVIRGKLCEQVME